MTFERLCDRVARQQIREYRSEGSYSRCRGRRTLDDLHLHHGDKTVDCIRAVNADGQVVVYTSTRVLQEAGDILDVRLVGVITVRCLSGESGGVGDIGRRDDRRLVCGVSYHPITARKVSKSG